MKRNFLAGLLGGLTGSMMLLVILSATGLVGAQGRSDVARDLNRNVATPALSVASTTFSSTFTYQGQLKTGSTAVTGACDIAFRLYDDPNAGSVIGSPFTPTISITNGLFTQALSFGANAFTGEARWLDLKVRCPAGSGPFTPLLPRQALAAAPYALALPGLWTQPNAVSPNIIGGYSNNFISPTVIGGVIGGGGSAVNINRVTSDFGVVGGGQGNTASQNNATVSGGGANTASGTAATIGGGDFNYARSDYAAIGGGNGNTVSGTDATVAGGVNNTASGNSAAIGGGNGNTVNAGYASVGGGFQNTASNAYATIGGGAANLASGYGATIPGGLSNLATGDYSFAAGSDAQAVHQGAFVWGDSTLATFASTGNNQFLIRAHGGVGINTNDPSSASLVVESDTTNINNNTAEFRAPNLGPNSSHIHWGTTGDWYIRSAASSGKVVLQDSGGNVGIGTGSPNDKLEVNGVLRVDTLGSAGATSLCLNASNQISSCSSSLRYKSNVSDLPLGLDAIAQLHPVTFNWKDSGQADLGFVAEDVNKVTPLLTTLNKDGQIEGVKYDRITAVLVKGMQEQQAQIAELQAQNAAQQQAITQLKSGVPAADQPVNVFNVVSVIALGSAIVIGLRQKRGGAR